MGPLLRNAYAAPAGVWWRGSFHAHTAEHSACATLSRTAVVAAERARGARFLALTDHDHVTPRDGCRTTGRGLVLLEGFEYSSCENVLFVGEHVPELAHAPLPDALAAAAALLTIIAHPEPQPGAGYWTYEKVRFLDRLPDGVEIYNGHYGTPRLRALGNQPQYTQFWDELLTAGHRLWGFANDDCHALEDCGTAFNMVRVTEPSAAGIVAAAKQGRCYASTGLLLRDVQVRGRRLHVTLRAAATGRFVGPGGRILAETRGTAFRYAVRDEAYVRFEAEGDAGKIFLQPWFRNP